MDTKKITTNESGNDAKREKVRVIPIQFFDDFPKHPFNVKMDAEMEALIESMFISTGRSDELTDEVKEKFGFVGDCKNWVEKI